MGSRDLEKRFCQKCGRVTETPAAEHGRQVECGHCKVPMEFYVVVAGHLEPEEGQVK